MSETFLIKISTYLKEIADLFSDLIEEIEGEDRRYIDLVRKHAMLEMRYENLEKDLEKMRFDKDYFENECYEKIEDDL